MRPRSALRPVSEPALKPGPHRISQRRSGAVCDRPSASRPAPSRQNRPVKTASSSAGGAGGGFDGTERAGTRSDGRKQGWNGAD